MKEEFQEKITESKQFLNERAQKDYCISMKLISDTSLDSSVISSLNEEERIGLIIRLKSIHLEWLNIKVIEHLQVFEHLNVLYLQHNKIVKIEGLDHLLNLEYLGLNNNLIQHVENLKTLKKLLGLNLNWNQIEQLEERELPENLQLLSFKQNPVTLDHDYQSKLINYLKHLQMLDDTVVSPQQKLKIIGSFPEHLMNYSNAMRQFYLKRSFADQASKENQHQPILIANNLINEKETLSQVREKTRKYLHGNQEQFKSDQLELEENFKDKIEFSQKIRKIKTDEEVKRVAKLSSINEEKDE